MFLIFFLLFLLPFTASGLSLDKHDEKALLKIKKQLGDPAILSSWVKGYDFCGNPTSTGPFVYATCNDNGTRINRFSIVDANITAPFPDAICDLSDLSIFGLSKLPGFYGPIPSCVTKLNLVVFNVQYTSLSGPVPSFYNSTKFFGIFLSNNRLSGTIPPSLSTLPNIQYLDLSSNYLTGTLPSVPLTPPNLFLSHNNLTGEIPKPYGSVGYYNTFDVGYNNLSGDASFLFGRNKYNIINIILANNNFEFDLSYVEFSGSLKILDLSHNKIYGKVPDSFAIAYGLMPNLSFNRLCGELPHGYMMQFYSAEQFANNTCLCGSPLPPCSNSAPAAAPIYTPPF